ncbi:MAG: pyridoxamine 5'-phosphate oxidase family protein [Desulfopila sp.]|nr:pyridoxamine 5'-phosphate oxidase family protein [Desulfopila sp.]
MKSIIRLEEMCVLATAADDIPHCSLMAYVSAEDCSRIHLITHKKTKKYSNFINNPSVSLLIDTRSSAPQGSRRNVKALTVNGTVAVVEDAATANVLRQEFITRHSHLREFAEDEDAVVVEVTIQSLQLLRGATDATYATIK